MKDKDGDTESCTLEHVPLLIQIPHLMRDLLANPAHQAVLSSSQECLEMHLRLIISGQLVQGTGELCGSVWCSALARSQDAGCRLKGCAETELVYKPCWTWAEPVQADSTVVNYTLCLAPYFFCFPINQGISDNNWLKSNPVLVVCPLNIAFYLRAQASWQLGDVLE